MEAYALEKDEQIISLEKELEALYREKEGALSSNEGLHSEIKSLSEMLNTSHSEVNKLQQELLVLKNRLEESKLEQQKMENSIKMLAEEKEELALKLTDSLLEMEEDRAIWSSKEKASLEAIEDKAKLYKKEIALLDMSENLNNQLLLVKKENDRLITQIQEQREHITEEQIRHEHNNDLLVEELIRRISSMEVKMQSDHVENIKEKAKVRMRLRGTQAKLDAFCYRCKEEEDEKNVMDKSFREATCNLKDRLALKGVEVLTLKKQLAAKG